MSFNNAAVNAVEDLLYGLSVSVSDGHVEENFSENLGIEFSAHFIIGA